MESLLVAVLIVAVIIWLAGYLPPPIDLIVRVIAVVALIIDLLSYV